MTPPPPPSSTADIDVSSVAFVSLGCPKNLVDSEKMLGMLAEDGLGIVSWDPSDESIAGEQGADAVVINTCGFLEASKEESLGVIKDAIAEKEAGRLKRVVVAGCLVQRHRAKMLEWAPGIDAMVGVFDRDRIVEAVRGAGHVRTNDVTDDAKPSYWITGNALQAAKEREMKTVGLTVQGKDGKGIGYFESDGARLRLTPRHWAYLRVSEGCNQRCAFCTIPSIRGKMRSKPLERIASEARELLLDGAFELSIIGQDTTSYGDDIGAGMQPGSSFAGGLPAMLKSVCEAVDQTNKAGWVRLMYAYPSNFSDEMIDAFAELCETSHLVPYLDIPLQHASDSMLTAMRRHVQASQQRKLMLKLRERIPGMAIRTTFITGFPGETEADHEQLLEFVDEIGFDAMGVFMYSREDGTPAGTMEADPALAIPQEIKQQRHDELMALQQKIAFEQAAYLAEQFDPETPTDSGVRFDVLIDRQTSTDGIETTGVSGAARLYEGRTYFQAPQIDAVTYVHSHARMSPGELVPCTIVGSSGYDLIARPVDHLDKKVTLPVLG